MQIAEHAGHNVVFCADRNYLPYLGVAAYSLLANNARLGLAIYIVTDEIDPPNRQRFERLSAEFGVPFTVYPVTAQDRNDIAGIRTQGHFSIANYFRLLIPRALPEAAQTVLYLDADMIVDGDISGLFGSAVAGKVLGACPDPVGRRMTGKPEYFNSGVMLINLRRWRELDISAQALAYAVRNAPKLCDQDALNEVVPRDAVFRLGMEYNYMIFDRLKTEYRQELERMYGGVGTPKILHYTGAIKPWHDWFMAEFRDKYLDYLRRSPWRDAPGVLKTRPDNAQQEFWLGEAAERDADFRKAAGYYKRAATRLMGKRG